MKINTKISKLIQEYTWSSPAIKLKGKLITSSEFALTVLELEKVAKIAEFYDCSRPTISNNIKKYLPELYSSTGGELYARVLDLIEYKKCYKCHEVKTFKEMRSRDGKADYLCKECGRAQDTSCKGKSQRKSREAKRRASKLERTPVWADLEAIKEFYINCPEGYHVDHIIPLQGKTVSGLHVLENLQYLTAEENLKKSNKFIPD